MSRPENYDWKKRWTKDLIQILKHVDEALNAVLNDDIVALEDAIAEIECLVESHA